MHVLFFSNAIYVYIKSYIFFYNCTYLIWCFLNLSESKNVIYFFNNLDLIISEIFNPRNDNCLPLLFFSRYKRLKCNWHLLQRRNRETRVAFHDNSTIKSCGGERYHRLHRRLNLTTDKLSRANARAISSSESISADCRISGRIRATFAMRITSISRANINSRPNDRH